MPYTLIWESDSSIWCQFYDRVGFEDINSATNEFYNDFRSDYVTTALWDFSRTSEIAISTMEASEMAATDSAASTYMKPLKSAFITSDPELAHLVEQYIKDMKKYGSLWTNGLFRTIEEARQWLVHP